MSKSLIREIKAQKWDSDSENQSDDPTNDNIIYLNDYFGLGRSTDCQENPGAVGLSVLPSNDFKIRLARYQEHIASKKVSRSSFSCIYGYQLY